MGLQIVGQPARDLCRHFVQRWNLLIRKKVRPTFTGGTDGRITHGECRSSSQQRTLPLASCTTSSFRGHARCRSVARSVRGQWALRPASSTPSRMLISNVCIIIALIASAMTIFSHRDVRTLRIHRKPVLHHVLCGRRRPHRERYRQSHQPCSS